jgi:hypothetical protein
MYVDGLYPLPADHHGQFVLLRLLCMGTAQHPAAAEDNAAGNGSTAGFEKITARGHWRTTPCLFVMSLV